MKEFNPLELPLAGTPIPDNSRELSFIVLTYYIL